MLVDRFMGFREQSLAARAATAAGLPRSGKPPAENLQSDLRLLDIAGAITGQADMDFYSALLSTLGGRYAGIVGTIPDPPPEPVRLPANWSSMTPTERSVFLRADLEAAVGEEYIDRKPQPLASRARTHSRRKKKLIMS
jgi:hypothetical protein